MRKLLIATLSCLALAMLVVQPASASSVKSLRGDLGIADSNKAVDMPSQKVTDKFERNYKQQPPLVPHKFEKYTISLKVNRCLKCHSKENYKEEEAPLPGKSHFIGADGKEMKEINMGRYFCNQCHVPQVIADPLVDNTFEGAK